MPLRVGAAESAGVGLPCWAAGETRTGASLIGSMLDRRSGVLRVGPTQPSADEG